MSVIQFQAIPVTLDAAAGDGESPRTITGIAAPWDTVATVLSGERVMFRRGAFATDAKMPKLIEGHDMAALRGVVTELVDLDEGLGFTAKFAKTRAADDAIELIKAGAYDSVSVGAIPVRYKYDKDGTMVVSEARLVEISLVAMAAFGDAAPITEIAASAPEDDANETPTPDDSKEEPMSDSPEIVEAAAPAIAATVPTAPLFAQPRREFTLPTAAEYVSKMLQGGTVWKEYQDRLKAAAPDVVTTDTPGILPEPIIGAVYNNFRGIRPVIDAVGVRAMPGGGKIFRRPEVTTHTTIGASNGENVALDSGTFVVSNNDVTKGVYGGFVKLSEEDMDWTDPSVLGLLIDDMARIYANETDNVAADNLRSGAATTRNFTGADTDDPAAWAAWIGGASKTILSASNGNLPTHLFVDPEVWAVLLALSDSSKRPLFPNVGAMNAFGGLEPGRDGGMAFGLQVVVDRNFANDTLILADPSGYELFEQQKGAVSVESSDGSMSRIVKFRGYFATLMIDPSKFVRAVFV